MLNAVPADNTIVDKAGRLVSVWQAFLSNVGYYLRPVTQSGTTANRPVDSSQIQLYVGQFYFDTSLGKPIWVKSRNPTVWCDATGAAV